MADSDRVYDVVGLGSGPFSRGQVAHPNSVEAPIDAAFFEGAPDCGRYTAVLLEGTTHTVFRNFAENQFVEHAPSASRQRGSESISTTDDHR